MEAGMKGMTHSPLLPNSQILFSFTKYFIKTPPLLICIQKEHNAGKLKMS